VLIRIQLEESDPPLGSACTEEGSPVGFQGWLELLRVLADMLGSTVHSEPPPGQVEHRLWWRDGWAARQAAEGGKGGG
jgi:hypothetical protein